MSEDQKNENEEDEMPCNRIYGHFKDNGFDLELAYENWMNTVVCWYNFCTEYSVLKMTSFIEGQCENMFKAGLAPIQAARWIHLLYEKLNQSDQHGN